PTQTFPSRARSIFLTQPSGASTLGRPGPTVWISTSRGVTSVGPSRFDSARTSDLAQLAMTAMYTIVVDPANLKGGGEWGGGFWGQQPIKYCFLWCARRDSTSRLSGS